MGIRLEHYSLDKEPFLTQALEIKLTNLDCVCSETNNGSSLLYRDFKQATIEIYRKSEGIFSITKVCFVKPCERFTTYLLGKVEKLLYKKNITFIA